MKQYFILYLWLLAETLVSCNNWLSLDAEDEIDSDYLFTEAEGYKNAMNGIYINIAREKLYGRELSWGFLSALSQYYAPSVSTAYKAAMEYDYSNTETDKIISNIWLEAYNAIANCNNVIGRIEKADPSLFIAGERERNAIWGEALGLRALLHLDMFRLFAPAPITGDKNPYVPYYKVYPSVMEPKLNADEFMANVIGDLLKARELIAPYDSTNTFLERLVARFDGNLMSDPEGGDYFNYRGTHLNLYAADALLARAYLYAGNKEKAFQYAWNLFDQHVVRNKHLALTSANNITSSLLKRYRKLYDGIILGFYNKQLLQVYEDYLTAHQGEMPLKNVEEMFAGNDDDYRKNYLLISNSKGHDVSIKYMRADERINNVNSYQGPLIPIIRLSEIYYILCECLIDSDKGRAVDLLNQLRLARGCKTDIPKTISADGLLEEIVLDARKDFIGEGQLFFMYKRLNRPVLDGNEKIIMGNKFVLPLPANETVL